MEEKVGPGFTVVGFSARVRNDDPQPIGALWEKFRGADLKALIGPAASREVYCVYHEYEGGFADPYRMTIGHRVTAETPVPEGCYRAEIPSQILEVFPVEGPQPQALIEKWQAIWAADIHRNYLADYDVYDRDQPQRVMVHVGVASG